MEVGRWFFFSVLAVNIQERIYIANIGHLEEDLFFSREIEGGTGRYMMIDPVDSC